MKFNLKFMFLLSSILFFAYVIIYNILSIPDVIYREGLKVDGVDVSGVEIHVTGSINENNLSLSEEPKMPIHPGDILLTKSGSIIKGASGNPITIDIASKTNFSLSETPENVSFKTVADYVIFSIEPGNKKTESISSDKTVNGKLDTSMNLILSSKPMIEIQSGNQLLFTNGDNVKDSSKKPIHIVKGSGLLYKLSGLADSKYDLYNKNADYMIDSSSSSVS